MMLQRLRLLGAGLALVALCASIAEATVASLCASMPAESAMAAGQDAHVEGEMAHAGHANDTEGTSSDAHPEDSGSCPLSSTMLAGCTAAATLPAGGLTAMAPASAATPAFLLITDPAGDGPGRNVFHPPRI